MQGSDLGLGREPWRGGDELLWRMAKMRFDFSRVVVVGRGGVGMGGASKICMWGKGECPQTLIMKETGEVDPNSTHFPAA